MAYKHKRDRDKSDPFRFQQGGSKDNPIELTSSIDDDAASDDPPAARVRYIPCYCLIRSEAANRSLPDRTLSVILHPTFSTRQLITALSTLIWQHNRQIPMPGQNQRMVTHTAYQGVLCPQAPTTLGYVLQTLHAFSSNTSTASKLLYQHVRILASVPICTDQSASNRC